MSKILVVDDDESLLSVVESALKREGFDVITATDGSEGLRSAFQNHPDLVILDIMLPGMSGLETCRRLRELSDMPIIMLTAMSRESDIVRGLTLGADDYVTKPFSIDELIARVYACLRRGSRRNTAEKSSVITVGRLTVDFARRKVTIDGEQVELTPTEFQLLSYLVRNRGVVIPHQRLLKEIWGPEYADQLDYLRLYVRYLRRKIEKDPSKPEIIKTEWGVGYYLENQ